MSVDVLAGQVLVGAFEGLKLPAATRERLAAGLLGGVTLFSRNVGDTRQVRELASAILAAAPVDLPPIVAVDQEGGRVARLPAPVLALPPMRLLGRIGREPLTEKCGRVLGGELRALGFNLDFAPVCDVDSNPANPVIGDRSFGEDPRTVMRHAVGFLRGLQTGGVMACAKHFPGHGDTSSDSHHELPVLEHDRKRLDRIELPPFRAAVGAGVATVMTAHVVCKGVDPEAPATLSSRVLSILRDDLSFSGLIVSDDLNMSAIGLPPGDAAVAAVRAGCDTVLVCRDDERQEAARSGLAAEARRSPAFLERLRDAARRSVSLRRAVPPRPATSADELERILGGVERAELCRELAAATGESGG